jgi:cell division protein ZapA
MDRAPVELCVGGQTNRVVASTSAETLRRLASVVDGMLREVATTSAFHPQSMLLVAMTLAHELEVERERRCEVEKKARDALCSLLERIDAALDVPEVDGEPPPDGEPPGRLRMGERPGLP